MSEAHFKPELFTLDPKVQQFQLDQEVAATIADALYLGDREVQAGNNYYDPKVIVDPTGESTTRTLSRTDEQNPDEDWSYRISFGAEEADDVNGAFAAQMKSALFEGERRNRLGVKGSLAMTGFLGLFPTGAAIAAAETNTAAGVKAEMVIGGLAFFGWLAKPMPQHFYRLNMVKPDSFVNKRQLRAAAQIAETLKLPPVVTK